MYDKNGWLIQINAMKYFKPLTHELQEWRDKEFDAETQEMHGVAVEYQRTIEDRIAAGEVYEVLF